MNHQQQQTKQKKKKRVVYEELIIVLSTCQLRDKLTLVNEPRSWLLDKITLF